MSKYSIDVPAEINKGKLSFSSRLKETIAGFPDGKYRLIVKKQVRKRTLDQNAYMHVLFQLLADETGHTLEEMKRIEKERHLPKVKLYMYGTVYERPSHTSDLSNPECSEFIEKIIADCAELGIHVPTREELGYSPK